MVHVNFIKDLLGSMPDYSKVVFLMLLITKDVDLMTECSFYKKNLNRLRKQFLKKQFNKTKNIPNLSKKKQNHLYRDFPINKKRITLRRCLKR